MGAAALTITGCPADDTGSDGTTGDTTGDPTTNPSTSMSGSGTSPSTTDSSTTVDPETGSSSSSEGSSSSGEPTGSSSSGGDTDTDTDATGSSGSSSSSGGAADCSGGAFDTAWTMDHGHTLSIDAKDLQAGTPVNGVLCTLANMHTHTVDLSGDDVDALLAGESIMVISSNDSGHMHTVTISC
jgi:hypothetical protein